MPAERHVGAPSLPSSAPAATTSGRSWHTLGLGLSEVSRPFGAHKLHHIGSIRPSWQPNRFVQTDEKASGRLLTAVWIWAFPKRHDKATFKQTWRSQDRVWKVHESSDAPARDLRSASGLRQTRSSVGRNSSQGTMASISTRGSRLASRLA